MWWFVWGWGEVRVATDKGDGTRGQRRVQGDCALILCRETGETWKVRSAWELCRRKKIAKKREAGGESV